MKNTGSREYFSGSLSRGVFSAATLYFVPTLFEVFCWIDVDTIIIVTKIGLRKISITRKPITGDDMELACDPQ